MPGAPQSASASDQSPPLGVTPLPRVHRGWRVFIFYSCALLLTGLVSMLFADLLWRTGWTSSDTFLLALFVVLFLLISVGCMHGIFGFLLRRTADRRLTRIKDYRSQSIQGTSTALVFPIHNEEVARVFEGLRAT